MSSWYFVNMITSQVIVIYLWYLVNIITIIICRCVPYKTHNSMSNVKVTESRRLYKCFDIWARHVAPGHLVYVTCLLIRINISIKFHEDTTRTCEVMAQTKYKLQNYDHWPLSVTLTFDIESWVLYLTHLHITVNISNKYHKDTTIVCEVMAWKKV